MPLSAEHPQRALAPGSPHIPAHSGQQSPRKPTLYTPGWGQVLGCWNQNVSQGGRHGLQLGSRPSISRRPPGPHCASISQAPQALVNPTSHWHIQEGHTHTHTHTRNQTWPPPCWLWAGRQGQQGIIHLLTGQQDTWGHPRGGSGEEGKPHTQTALISPHPRPWTHLSPES